MVLFGVSLLFLLLVWNLSKKTALDHTRDCLFDLRDDIRMYFLSNEYDLDSTTYMELRNLINTYLRFTENQRFIGLIYLYTKGISDTVKENIIAEFNQRFTTDDPTLQRYIDGVRGQTVRIVLKYMILTSTITVSMTLAIIPIIGIVALKDGFVGLFKRTKSSFIKLVSTRPYTNQGALEIAVVISKA